MRLPLWVIPAGLVVLFSACHSGKPLIGRSTSDLHPKSAAELQEDLAARTPANARYFSAKADISLKTTTDNKSFKAHLRVVRDSAAWVSITPALGIEVARALLTTDSLFLIDKIHDTYWLGDTTQAQTKFGVKPTLQLFQDALLGLPIGLDPTEKYRSDREDGMYTLTNVFRDPKERGRAIAIWAGFSGLGVALGPVIGGVLLTHFSWSSVFWVNLPIGAIALVAGHFYVPESKDPSAAVRHPAPPAFRRVAHG